MPTYLDILIKGVEVDKSLGITRRIATPTILHLLLRCTIVRLLKCSIYHEPFYRTKTGSDRRLARRSSSLIDSRPFWKNSDTSDCDLSLEATMVAASVLRNSDTSNHSYRLLTHGR